MTRSSSQVERSLGLVVLVVDRVGITGEDLSEDPANIASKYSQSFSELNTFFPDKLQFDKKLSNQLKLI